MADGGSIFTTMSVLMMTAVFGVMRFALRIRIRLLMEEDPPEPVTACPEEGAAAACPGGGCAVIACEEDAVPPVVGAGAGTTERLMIS